MNERERDGNDNGDGAGVGDSNCDCSGNGDDDGDGVIICGRANVAVLIDTPDKTGTYWVPLGRDLAWELESNCFLELINDCPGSVLEFLLE